MKPESARAGWSTKDVDETRDQWELSDDEVEMLKKLGSDLSDIDHWKNTCAEVVRFMRARPGKPKQAEAMFRKMINWRKDQNVDTLLDDYEPPDLLLKFYPGAVLQGLDKDGDPIYVGRLGVTDAAAMIERFGKAEMIRHAIWNHERISRGNWIKEYEKNQGRPVRRITLIEDLAGLSYSSHGSRTLLKTYGEIMRIDQDNYPETSKRLIILRSPSAFRLIWKGFTVFLDPGVVRKMIFTSTSNYKSTLEKYIDLSVLPPELVPQGKGEAWAGMRGNFLGGRLPNESEEDSVNEKKT